ncbi:hypothetical protein E5288_WYG014652 [Bos mutus]|uniref:Uncharacterized protein n=1 Tax=Bos mutus TaxID=72004 RepID=A0A6B0R372_9CETA|nr:hypothetical protein [Bos mutus]
MKPLAEPSFREEAQESLSVEECGEIPVVSQGTLQKRPDAEGKWVFLDLDPTRHYPPSQDEWGKIQDAKEAFAVLEKYLNQAFQICMP